MSRGLRNNNPGNIRTSGQLWQGEVIPSQDEAFKQFKSMAYGYRAMFVLLNTYHGKGFTTLRAMIGRWAPPIENDTQAYVDAVSRQAGIDPDAVISPADRSVMAPVVAAMSKGANGVPAIMSDVEAGWDLYMATRK